MKYGLTRCVLAAALAVTLMVVGGSGGGGGGAPTMNVAATASLPSVSTTSPLGAL